MATTAGVTGHMPVISADNQQIAAVDHLDTQDTVKLTRDDQGNHHWIPSSWVADVDDKVHINVSADQARREWMSTAPARE